MVALYVKRIGAGKMELKQVPTRWRDAVEKEMQEV